MPGPLKKPIAPKPEPGAATTKLHAAAGILFLLAFLYFVALPQGILRNGRSGPAGRGSGAVRKIQIKLSGRLIMPPQIDPALVAVHVHVPQIPFDAVRSAKDLLKDDGHEFSLDLSFDAKTVPTSLSLRATSPGGGSAESGELKLISESDSPALCKLHCQTAGDLVIRVEKLAEPRPPAAPPRLPTGAEPPPLPNARLQQLRQQKEQRLEQIRSRGRGKVSQ